MNKEKRSKKVLNIIIFILVGIMLFFLKSDNRDRFIGFIQSIGVSNREFKDVGTISVKGEVKDLAYYDKGIVVWEDNKLIKFKIDGSKEWERIFNVDDLGIKFGENKIYVYDKNIGDIYFLNLRGETIKKVHLKVEMQNMIETFGDIIVHIKNSDMEGIIILDQEGEIVEERNIEKGNILTYSLDKENQLYSISLLDLTEDGLGSQVKVFRLGGETYFDIPISNEIIMYSKFIDGNKIVVVSDKGLYCIHEGEILWDKRLKSVNDVYIDGEKINILHEDRLQVISLDGKVLSTRSFAEEYNSINAYDSGLILFGNEYITGIKGDKEMFKYAGEVDILKAIQERDKLIIGYKNKIDIVSK